MKTLSTKFSKICQGISLASVVATLIISSNLAFADDYIIDKKGAHASIQFKISHLGYSWLWGRFNNFEGNFSYDEKKPAAAKVVVTVQTDSIDSNHAERDKHLRSKDFLDVSKYPQAKFISSAFTAGKNGDAKVKGKLTLHGVTRDIVIDAKQIGAGNDPWGGYRRGFEGKTRIALADYGITKNLGPASAELDLILAIEGIKQ